jgi:hypothetical protein
VLFINIWIWYLQITDLQKLWLQHLTSPESENIFILPIILVFHSSFYMGVKLGLSLQSKTLLTMEARVSHQESPSGIHDG